MVALLEVGDTVDLVATDPQHATAATVAAQVPVLALPLPDASDPGTGTLPGRLVVLGLTDSEVPEVSAAAIAQFLTFTWSGEPPSR